MNQIYRLRVYCEQKLQFTKLSTQQEDEITKSLSLSLLIGCIYSRRFTAGFTPKVCANLRLGSEVNLLPRFRVFFVRVYHLSYLKVYPDTYGFTGQVTMFWSHSFLNLQGKSFEFNPRGLLEFSRVNISLTTQIVKSGKIWLVNHYKTSRFTSVGKVLVNHSVNRATKP